jgi:hypothetical protein
MKCNQCRKDIAPPRDEKGRIEEFFKCWRTGKIAQAVK